MGQLSFMLLVVDRNVVMRRIPVLCLYYAGPKKFESYSGRDGALCHRQRTLWNYEYFDTLLAGTQKPGCSQAGSWQSLACLLYSHWNIFFVLLSSAHAWTLSLPVLAVRGPTIDEGIGAAVNIHLATCLCHITGCPINTSRTSTVPSRSVLRWHKFGSQNSYITDTLRI